MNPVSAKRAQLANDILERKVSAIIRTHDQQSAHDAIQAAVDGGFRMVEFTLTTPGALELVSQFAKQPGLLVGAGTVLTVQLARDAVDAGARFLVSPIMDPVIIAEAQRLDVPMIPGTFTPTEMETAYRLGADFCKLFPAAPGGPEYVRAIRAPLPHLRIFPTAGVTTENFTDFLDVGCAGAGFVAGLFTPEDMARRDYVAIRRRAELVSKRLSDWRSKPSH